MAQEEDPQGRGEALQGDGHGQGAASQLDETPHPDQEDHQAEAQAPQGDRAGRVARPHGQAAHLLGHLANPPSATGRTNLSGPAEAAGEASASGGPDRSPDRWSEKRGSTMPRVKRGNKRLPEAQEGSQALAAVSSASSRNAYRMAKQAVDRAGSYAYRDRRAEEAALPLALDRPHQRRRPPARAFLQPPHRRPQGRRLRARPQGAGRARGGGRPASLRHLVDLAASSDRPRSRRRPRPDGAPAPRRPRADCRPASSLAAWPGSAEAATRRGADRAAWEALRVAVGRGAGTAGSARPPGADRPGRRPRAFGQASTASRRVSRLALERRTAELDRPARGRAPPDAPPRRRHPARPPAAARLAPPGDPGRRARSEQIFARPRLQRRRGAGDRGRLLQLRGAQLPRGPPGARHAGHLLPRGRTCCCAPTPRRCRSAPCWSASRRSG